MHFKIVAFTIDGVLRSSMEMKLCGVKLLISVQLFFSKFRLEVVLTVIVIIALWESNFDCITKITNCGFLNVRVRLRELVAITLFERLEMILGSKIDW
jgi:hypothetical protein